MDATTISAVNSLASQIGLPIWAFLLLSIWSMLWKLAACWKSSRLNQPVWFVVLFFINTFGILEILYLFLFSKMPVHKRKSRSR